MAEQIKRALIVDDDKQVRHMLSQLLQKDSIRTYAVQSAEEALSFLSRCEEDHIQVVLVDISLPGMTGLQLVKRIRKNDPLIVTIALTGFGDLFTILKCREAGFDDYLNKPISIAVLRAALIGAFKRARYWEGVAKREKDSRLKKRPHESDI